MGLLKVLPSAAAAVVVLFLCTFTARADAPEYQVKAAMLYKFAVFVEWPATAFSAGNSPFVACIVGTDPFGPWLQREMGEAGVGTHPVEIRHGDEKRGSGCHLIFITASEAPRLQEVLAALHNNTALIVSDVNEANQFCHWGGMISLVMEGAKVRFKLNSRAIEKAGLKIDSKLKRVALSVQCGEQGK